MATWGSYFSFAKKTEAASDEPTQEAGSAITTSTQPKKQASTPLSGTDTRKLYDLSTMPPSSTQVPRFISAAAKRAKMFGYVNLSLEVEDIVQAQKTVEQVATPSISRGPQSRALLQLDELLEMEELMSQSYVEPETSAPRKNVFSTILVGAPLIVTQLSDSSSTKQSIGSSRKLSPISPISNSTISPASSVASSIFSPISRNVISPATSTASSDFSPIFKGPGSPESLLPSSKFSSDSSAFNSYRSSSASRPSHFSRGSSSSTSSTLPSIEDYEAQRLRVEKEVDDTREQMQEYLRQVEQIRLEKVEMEEEKRGMIEEKLAFEREEKRIKEEEESMKMIVEDVRREQQKEEAEEEERRKVFENEKRRRREEKEREEDTEYERNKLREKYEGARRSIRSNEYEMPGSDQSGSDEREGADREAEKKEQQKIEQQSRREEEEEKREAQKVQDKQRADDQARITREIKQLAQFEQDEAKRQAEFHEGQEEDRPLTKEEEITKAEEKILAAFAALAQEKSSQATQPAPFIAHKRESTEISEYGRGIQPAGRMSRADKALPELKVTRFNTIAAGPRPPSKKNPVAMARMNTVGGLPSGPRGNRPLLASGIRGNGMTGASRGGLPTGPRGRV